MTGKDATMADLREAEARAHQAEARLKEAKSGSLKRIIFAAVLGGAVLAIGTSYWPGWQLDSTAERAAEQAVRAERIEILGAFCAATARSDPSTLATISAQSSAWQRVSDIAKSDWMNFSELGINAPSRDTRRIASKCDDLLQSSSTES